MCVFLKPNWMIDNNREYHSLEIYFFKIYIEMYFYLL